MKQEESLARRRSTAPKSAAIAGSVFSVLLAISLVSILISMPVNLRDGGAWLSTKRNTLLLAFNLVPFAGIAFLWFIGVVRDRRKPICPTKVICSASQLCPCRGVLKQ